MTTPAALKVEYSYKIRKNFVYISFFIGFDLVVRHILSNLHTQPKIKYLNYDIQRAFRRQ